jgi:NitT/TauT family transport system ATP-binding protein
MPSVAESGAVRSEKTSRAVELRDVRRVFPGGVEVLAGIDLAVQEGEFVALLGPSGCGKSTLLRLVAGLDRAQAGIVRAWPLGTDGPPRRREAEPPVAFVFQDAHLLPWRTVLDNVALPLELTGRPRSDRLAAAAAAVEQVGLSDAAARYPAQLSGGMRMRVSIARALVTRPRILLLDEPFAALDEITRQHLDEQLRGLWRRRRMTVLFVTHAIAEAAYLAERVVVLSRRPATVIADVAIRLPEDRSAELRSDDRFFAALRDLRGCLERAEG